MKMTKWAACCAALWCAWPAAAQAGEFDARGVYTLDAALTEGFEEGSELDVLGIRVEGGAAAAEEMFQDVPGGLEGERALKTGGVVYQTLLRVDDGRFDALAGRRVEVTMWVKSQGTDLSIALGWRVGDIDAYLQGEFRASAPLGYVTLMPTGRATTDGWKELTTGPFDWSLAGRATPSWFNVQSEQHVYNFYTRSLDYAVTQTALIDAIEFKDLGEAAVPANRCTAGDEDEVCGELGVCHLGRCADAATVLGQLPTEAIRADFLERLVQQVDLFTGPRLGRERLEEVARRWRALAQATSPKAFWRELSVTHELLLDGHGAPPRNTFFDVYSSGGVCMGPGQADLLPGQDPDALVPIVFYTNPELELGDAPLAPGDVLVEVDGMPVWDWMEQNRARFYFNGDTGGRDAMITSDIMSQAIAAGSTLRFERCAAPEVGEPTACEPADVVSIEVDAGAWAQPFWEDQIPDNYYRFFDCDRRFAPFERPGPRTSTYEFSAWREIDGARHIIFNGFPSTFGQDGERWTQAFTQGLTGSPERVLIDQRTGFGGQVDSVNFLVGLLLAPENGVFASFMPWVGEVLDDTIRAAARTCQVTTGQRSDVCGGFFDMIPNEDRANGAAADARLALVNGFDVSGNDYFSQFMRYRGAPTRIFGYGPTIGAFGVSCQMPALIGEFSPMAYQCHDSTFTGDDGVEGDWTSGIGVAADEVVYQRQSDAVQGIDTVLARAQAWLAEEEGQ
jgi:hypothetical protein